MPRGSSHKTGRIHPHQRDADFSGAVLGDDIVLEDRYVTSVQDTEQYNICVKTKRTHRNRIKQIYSFWEDQFPQYYAVGVRAVPQADLDIDATTKRGHRNRIRQIYVALEENFPEYYALVRDNAAIHMSVKTNILRMFYGRNGDYTDLSFRILFFTLPTRSLGAQSYRAYVY